MSFNPEAAYAALYARFQQATAFRFSSRRLQSWDDTPPAECPAFFLAMGDMTPPTEERALPPLWRVACTLVMYARNDADPTAAPSIQLNSLIAAIVNLLQLQPGETPAQGAQFVARPTGQYATTLGGLAASVRVAGAIRIDEGLIGGGAAAAIPIEMLLSS